MNGDCQGALLKYDEYFQKRKSLTNEEKFEYADIATCAKNYQKAIDLYNEILNAGFDFKAALLKAQNLFSIGDTTEARTELESLAKLKPDDIHAKMLLADTYTAIKKFNDAEKLYREVLSDSNSTYTKNDIYQKMIFLAGSLIDDKQFEKGKKLYEEIYNSTVDSNLKEQIDQRMRELSLLYSSANVINSIVILFPDEVKREKAIEGLRTLLTHMHIEGMLESTKDNAQEVLVTQ